MATAEKVVIAAPIRDRAWILPDYLDHLRIAHNASPLDIAYIFLENDSIDSTSDLLKEFAVDAQATILKHDFGYKHYRVTERERGLPGVNPSNDKAELAILRNMIVDEFLKTDGDYLLFWDSDVILPELALSDDPKSLTSIIKHRSIGILAADVQHPHCQGKFHNYMYETSPGKYNHPKRHPKTALVYCDTVGGGGAALFRREIFSWGLRFGPHPQGEDIAVCRAAKGHGFQIVVNKMIRGLHIAKDQYRAVDISGYPYGIFIEDWLKAEHESHRLEPAYQGTGSVDRADS